MAGYDAPCPQQLARPPQVGRLETVDESAM